MQVLNDPDSLATVADCERDVAFEELLSVTLDAYAAKLQVRSEYAIFYHKLDQYPLSESCKAAIHEEIEYADDIDVEWDEDEEEALAAWLPKLAEEFGV